MFTLIVAPLLIVIGLWGLVALGKLIQTLRGINRTLEEIKVVLEDRSTVSR
jgi:hypothetical protein